MSVPTILQEIVATRRSHLAGITQRIAHVDRTSLPKSTRSLYDALTADREAGVHFIMECKSASPSLGVIREDYNPGAIARIYSRYACAISVLCEPDRFHGDYDHLATVAASTHLPVLCKDFIIDEVQLYAARWFGADAALLMLSVLDDETYSHLAKVADSLGLDVLTEVVNEEEMARATRLGAKIIGINHRDLHDLSIDLSRSGKLAPLAPEGAAIVAESGIRDHATVRRLAGPVHGFLVGSQLTGENDVDAAARALVFGTNKVCGITSPRIAQAARAVGAVYGGLIFEPASPRCVTRQQAEKIIAAEPDLKFVAVARSHKDWPELAMPGIAAIQVHAPLHDTVAEEKAFVALLAKRVGGRAEIWRAISMTDPKGPAIARALADDDNVALLVLDSGAGGTGQSFDWSTVPPSVPARALLAGGLTEENLKQALACGFAGVDFNSGAEYPSPEFHHMKDTGRLRRLFATIRADQAD